MLSNTEDIKNFKQICVDTAKKLSGFNIYVDNIFKGDGMSVREIYIIDCNKIITSNMDIKYYEHIKLIVALICEIKLEKYKCIVFESASMDRGEKVVILNFILNNGNIFQIFCKLCIIQNKNYFSFVLSICDENIKKKYDCLDGNFYNKYDKKDYQNTNIDDIDGINLAYDYYDYDNFPNVFTEQPIKNLVINHDIHFKFI